MFKILFSFLFLFIGCSDIVKKIEDQNYYSQVNAKTGSESVSLIFTHNINGETHPCGCRHFPLGGLAQVAGVLNEHRQKGPVIFIDTGDTYFPSNKIPESMNQSLEFIANEIHASLEVLNLDYYLPGDQDFALGANFLEKLSKKSKFKFVISNLIDTSPIKHVPWIKIKISETKNIFLMGIVSKDTLPVNIQGMFKDEIESIKKNLDQLKEYKEKNDEIILLSHSGMDQDKNYASKFPEINWIIGAHSMNFLSEPFTQGNTQIVQVLSRNHYLGKIELSLATPSKNYSIIEVRDDWKDKLNPNPFIKRLENHKTELKKIQELEQNQMSQNFGEIQKIPTANSCLECHQSQVEFWQKTAHSLAFETLRQNKEENNRNCIACHSVGFLKPEGFSKTKNIVLKNSKDFDEKTHTQYWNNVSDFFKTKTSIRNMSEADRKKISVSWQKLDQKMKVSHNFANVQCLNCHDKSASHPFENDHEKVKSNMKNKCLSCHNNDQSPGWYTKNKKGLADALDLKVYGEKLKQVACPKS